MALFFSATLGLVRNRGCLLRDRFRLQLSNPRIPNDHAISQRGIDAPGYCGDSECHLEHIIFSGKKSPGHFCFFPGLFDCWGFVLVLPASVRHSCGIGSRHLYGLSSLRERLGLSDMAIKQQRAVKISSE